MSCRLHVLDASSFLSAIGHWGHEPLARSGSRLLSRHGSSDQQALDVVASQPLRNVAAPASRRPRPSLEVQAVREPDDRLDDRHVAGVVGDVRHEAAIDLQRPERELLEVAQRRVPLAEVVERQLIRRGRAVPECRAARSGSRMTMLSVTSRIRSSVHPRLVQDPLDRLQQVGLRELARRDVHGCPDREASLAPTACSPAHAARRHDQVSATISPVSSATATNAPATAGRARVFPAYERLEPRRSGLSTTTRWAGSTPRARRARSPGAARTRSAGPSAPRHAWPASKTSTRPRPASLARYMAV